MTSVSPSVHRRHGAGRAVLAAIFIAAQLMLSAHTHAAAPSRASSGGAVRADAGIVLETGDCRLCVLGSHSRPLPPARAVPIRLQDGALVVSLVKTPAVHAGERREHPARAPPSRLLFRA